MTFLWCSLFSNRISLKIKNEFKSKREKCLMKWLSLACILSIHVNERETYKNHNAYWIWYNCLSTFNMIFIRVLLSETWAVFATKERAKELGCIVVIHNTEIFKWYQCQAEVSWYWYDTHSPVLSIPMCSHILEILWLEAMFMCPLRGWTGHWQGWNLQSFRTKYVQLSTKSVYICIVLPIYHDGSS